MNRTAAGPSAKHLVTCEDLDEWHCRPPFTHTPGGRDSRRALTRSRRVLGFDGSLALPVGPKYLKQTVPVCRM